MLRCGGLLRCRTRGGQEQRVGRVECDERVRRDFRPRLKQAGLPLFTFRDLRHVAGSIALDRQFKRRYRPPAASSGR